MIILPFNVTEFYKISDAVISNLSNIDEPLLSYIT